MVARSIFRLSAVFHMHPATGCGQSLLCPAPMQCSCFTSKNCLLMPHGAYSDIQGHRHVSGASCEVWVQFQTNAHHTNASHGRRWESNSGLLSVSLLSASSYKSCSLIIWKSQNYPVPKKSNHKVISAKNIHTTRCYRQLMHQLHKSLSVKLQQADILHHAK